MTPRICKSCGCTQDNPCEGRCWWVAPDLCSSCEGRHSRLDLDELVGHHHDRRLQLSTTVGPVGVIHGGDNNPQAFVSELIRLARIGQKVETAAAATAGRQIAETPIDWTGRTLLTWSTKSGEYALRRFDGAWDATQPPAPADTLWTWLPRDLPAEAAKALVWHADAVASGRDGRA